MRTAALSSPVAAPPRAPQVALLADGRRLHLNDGPIDLVIEASGDPRQVAAAYRAAVARFTGLLDALCAELPLLRRPAYAGACPLEGKVARRMWAAVEPHARAGFITPMAAVAGAVGEEVLEALALPGITRAHVNNGGDIALHLTPGADYVAGLVDRPDRPRLIGTARVSADSPVRGIATSGWRGRSFSLGIADAVTVLAPTAAAADAAATVIANAVNLPGHPGIARIAARDVQPDSDLGPLKVTRAVPQLSPAEIDEALAEGLACAGALVARGLISSAALHLQGVSVSTDPADGTFAGRPFLSLARQQESEAAHA
ncbi:UPF0280 family protein [Xanthobacter autotrophicus]|uniref:UPF0280 family protein n=1 Tax=Xanthobacter autotrophicus TaxID=280 RepID=UPI0024A6106C|nr:UPF0280 family protein [Xanthobacter autotrophicus]MDI4658647.1 UPF0280 family protein [Xanthobacter autotrophicus]